MGSGASNLFTSNPNKRQFVEKDVPSFKIVLVGDSNVGKSSVFLRYIREQFDYSYQPTISVNIGSVTKKVQLPYETLVSVSLWDLPGREEIDLRRCYYKDIDAAIVIVDLCDRESINMAGTWVQDINNNSVFTEDGENNNTRERKKSMKSQWQVPILLLGNKLDKLHIPPENDMADEIKLLEDVAAQHNFVGCAAVSACESDGGVHMAIRSLVRYLLQKQDPKRSRQFEVDQHHQSLLATFVDLSARNKLMQRLGSVDDYQYESLKPCNIKELDDVIRTSNKHTHQIEMGTVNLLISLKNFKRACCVSGVTDSYKTTMEECVSNLREELRSSGNQDIVEPVEQEGFIKFQLSKSLEEIAGPIRRILDIYNNEVCKYMHVVQSRFPSLKEFLSEHLDKLTSNQQTFTIDVFAQRGLSKKESKLSVSRLHGTIERVKDTLKLSQLAQDFNSDQLKMIKNALLW